VAVYQPVEGYGLIGNMRTAALVGKNGSIDWLCFPNLDSASVFAAILDGNKGGRFAVRPADKVISYKQMYWPETNVLTTRFHCCDGVAEVTDFMPVRDGPVHHDSHMLIRKVTVLSGKLGIVVECEPAFNYARDEHDTVITEKTACFHSPELSLGLATDVPFKQKAGGVAGDFVLKEGSSAVFVLQAIDSGGGCGLPVSPERATELFKETVAYWRRWLARCTYTGRWREMVHRSALVLKLLTFEPTGAIVAAPTCSLPETVGGLQNWDYRYVWIRDAAFTVYALMRIEEQVLEHLQGYKSSGPVRVGNAAYKQLQLDIYGELMDSVYLYNKYGSTISYDLWQKLHRIIDWVCENWSSKDEGIWEFRTGRDHYVYSKLMCWVALDRGLRLAAKRSFPADIDRWLRCRDDIYTEIIEKGWSRGRQAYVQSYDTDILDAGNLIMPLVFFMSPTDPRMLKTLDAINRPLAAGGLVRNSLVYRFEQAAGGNGIGAGEGTFNICGFWLIEAMTRVGRVDRARLEDARLMFEKMLQYANHLGLFAEQIGPCGEALGNFPQAFSHIALISAAYNLNKSLEQRL